MNEIDSVNANEELTITDETDNGFSENDLTEKNSPPESITEPPPSMEQLNQTIASLQAELEAYKSAAAQQEAIAKQINEFSELFPEITVRSIPDEVWDSVKQGNSLAAAYSVYERRITDV